MRYAECERETSETRITVVLDLDGGTRRDISTGIAFFDHMLAQLAFHGQFDLGVKAEGDLEIEDHHTVEDVGIVLGQAFSQALENADPIERYASNHTAMDDALILCALDISGRPGIYWEGEFHREKLGGLSTENVHEFFKSLAMSAGFTLHVRKIAGHNDHHVVEAMFKAVGRAIFTATRSIERRGSTSTKGKRGV